MGTIYNQFGLETKMVIEPERLPIAGGHKSHNHIDLTNIERKVERCPKHVFGKPPRPPGNVHHNARAIVAVIAHHAPNLPPEYRPDTSKVRTRG